MVLCSPAFPSCSFPLSDQHLLVLYLCSPTCSLWSHLTELKRLPGWDGGMSFLLHFEVWQMEKRRPVPKTPVYILPVLWCLLSLVVLLSLYFPRLSVMTCWGEVGYSKGVCVMSTGWVQIAWWRTLLSTRSWVLKLLTSKVPEHSVKLLCCA